MNPTNSHFSHVAAALTCISTLVGPASRTRTSRRTSSTTSKTRYAAIQRPGLRAHSCSGRKLRSGRRSSELRESRRLATPSTSAASAAMNTTSTAV